MLALLCAKMDQSSLAQKELAWPLGDNHQSYSGIDEAVAKAGSKSSLAIVHSSEKRSRIQPKSVAQMNECLRTCRCSCHQLLRFHVPRFGALELSGFRFPNSRNDCDVQSCKGPNPLLIRASICLPAWVARRVLSLWFTSSALHGPELLLRVPRVISRFDPVLQTLREGDLSGFKRLVAQGQGSPYDVAGYEISFAMVYNKFVFGMLCSISLLTLGLTDCNA